MAYLALIEINSIMKQSSGEMNVMNNINVLAVFLLLVVFMPFAKADPIKVRSIDGKAVSTSEIIGIVGESVKIKGGNGEIATIPLAHLDRDTHIRIISELGRQLELSLKSVARPSTAPKNAPSNPPLAVNLVDVADDPSDYVGKTVTFLVWLRPRYLSRMRLENGDEEVLLDGYLVPYLRDGSKPIAQGDPVGNEFGFLSGKNKINPFMHKDFGRQIKETLDRTKTYKMKATCQIIRVTVKDIASFDYNIAVITKLEQP